MDIIKSAFAGTMESSDAFVEIEPSENSVNVEIESIVKQQFGKQIESAVLDVLDQCNVKNAEVRIFDRGALECVIRARVETAIARAREE